ncbi:hypothetical protein pb186bvf_005519 [Paramecium bursaria]
MQRQTSSSQRVFNNQFQIVKKLSSGSFGVVFLGLDLQTQQEVAIKIEKEENEDIRSLEREVAILKKLDGQDGFPRFYWSGEEQGYNVLVIQLLGKDLSFYFKIFKRFSLKTVINVGVQCFSNLEKSHSKGVLHRDLKPENIILGTGRDVNKIYLIDFGISKFYRDSSGRHIPFKDGKTFLGTTRYASIAAHKGNEQGRKDDLESMMYILLFFLRGQLPWQNMPNVTEEDRCQKVGDLKASLQDTLFKDYPVEFQRIYDYIRKLHFKSEPNYKMILQEFKKAADSQKIIIDGTYDWSEIRQSIHTSTQADTAIPSKIAPNNSNEMKKSIEKQLSGLQLGSHNLLAPPPLSSRQREEGRKSSRVSQQSNISNNAASYSVVPKYAPSILEFKGSRSFEIDEKVEDWCDFDGDEIDEEGQLYQKYQHIKNGFRLNFFPRHPKHYR